MGRIFVGQTALYIEARVYQSIVGALELSIKYRKPDGSVGSFPATSVDDDNGHIRYYITSEDDVDQAGRWVFWGYVTFADGRSAAGEPKERMVYLEGYVDR